MTGQTDSTDFNNVGEIEGNSACTDAFVSKLTPAGNGARLLDLPGRRRNDDAGGIAVDSSGAAYVDRLHVLDRLQHRRPEIEGDSAGTDAFVAKLTPAGSALAYSTYLGGDADDGRRDRRRLHRRAPTSPASPTRPTSTPWTRSRATRPATDAFVAKLPPQASALDYSTYLGGDGADEGNGIAVDAAGAAYVTGSTFSTDFNTVGEIEGNSPDGAADAFVSKLIPPATRSPTRPTWAATAPITASGSLSTPPAPPTSTGSTGSHRLQHRRPDRGQLGRRDAFVTKLIPAGSALAYSTYLGGDAVDERAGIAVDSAGAAYVTGPTVSTDFNTVGQIEGDSAARDAFVSKLTPAGNALAYSTYLGGDSDDLGLGIAVDSAGAAYVTGPTDSDRLRHPWRDRGRLGLRGCLRLQAPCVLDHRHRR